MLTPVTEEAHQLGSWVWSSLPVGLSLEPWDSRVAAASCMSPDSTQRSVRRAPRGLVWFITGLALVAAGLAVWAWRGDNSFVNAGSPTVVPTSAPTASANPTSRSAVPTATPSTSSTPTKGARPTKSARKGLDGPYTLLIPRIGVNARVVPIQTDAQRVLNPPKDPSVAGWWSDGATPGSRRGSAVLVGHTVRNSGGGVFDDVGDLDRGDAIEVEGSDSALGYRVKSVEVLSKDEVARQAEEIFAQSGAGRLVIITCDDWDGTAWRSNIVTVATPA